MENLRKGQEVNQVLQRKGRRKVVGNVDRDVREETGLVPTAKNPGRVAKKSQRAKRRQSMMAFLPNKKCALFLKQLYPQVKVTAMMIN